MLPSLLLDRLCELIPRGGAPPDLPRVAVAWSGGADSTALLLAYIEALGDPPPHPVLALHIDHRMRDESADDAAWCRKRAADIGPDRLRLMTLTLPEGPTIAASPGSGEGPARQARYRLLGDTLRDLGVGLLMTAHHADDNLESFLLALIRGAGLTGLAGARSAIDLNLITGRESDRGLRLLRPLLDTPRSLLGDWLGARGESWIEDPTNALRDRRRNILRHEIVPRLRAVADDPEPMRRTLRVLARDRGLIERLAEGALAQLRRRRPHHFESGLALDAEGLARTDSALAAHVLRTGLRSIASARPYPPDGASIERVLGVASKPVGGSHRLQITGGVEVVVESGLIVLGARLRTAPEPLRLSVPGEIRWGDLMIRATLSPGATRGLEVRGQVETFDATALSFPLRVRSAVRGERLEKWGGGHKRLSRLMIDRKIPRLARTWVPVVEDENGKVLWLSPLVRSASAPVEDASASVLVLEVFEIDPLAQVEDDD